MEAAALLAGELELVGESCKPLDRCGRVLAHFDEVAIRIAHVASPLMTVIIERFSNEMAAIGASARLIGHLPVLFCYHFRRCPERAIVLSLRPDAAHARIRCSRSRIRAACGHLNFLSG